MFKCFTIVGTQILTNEKNIKNKGENGEGLLSIVVLKRPRKINYFISKEGQGFLGKGIALYSGICG